MARYHASNPARVRVEFGHFLKCDLKDVLIAGGSILIAAALAAVNWKLALIILLVGLGVVVFSVFETRKLFAEGDVCPAIVVDAGRNLIAVLADLSKTQDELPAVKILKQPLGRVAGGPFKNNTRLAFVAMYNGYPHEPRWKSFGGYLVNSGTTKKKAIQRVVGSVPGEDWDRLEDALSQIPSPFRPGQYEELDV